ncbi:hypothetical protein VNO77_46284 [Canavalia gladiata]|uniref:Uncharacterized protein n=1 Tax=Canavalia gladiata TaxID=3824 RepID=A0AAN9JIU0_CANGL
MEGVYSERSERRRGHPGLLKSRPTARSLSAFQILLSSSVKEGKEGGCESPGLRICRLVDSRNHLLRKKRPSGPDPKMNRKRGGRGSFIKGGKRGVGPPCAALERRDFQKVTLSNLFYLSLEVGRDKAQSHTLTSMMGTTSALRRSNEQEFSA